MQYAIADLLEENRSGLSDKSINLSPLTARCRNESQKRLEWQQNSL